MILAHGKPLKITHIMHKANINCQNLKESLEFLITQGLAENRMNIEKHTVFSAYTITQKGINALGHFNELNQALPIVGRQTSMIPLFTKDRQFSENFVLVQTRQ
jgi:predicted transcriptional regulator